jgi:hypothetical protein
LIMEHGSTHLVLKVKKSDKIVAEGKGIDV